MTKSEKPEGQEEWRSLAQQIQHESDPQKMIELVQQMIAKFDKEKLQKSPPPSLKIQNRPNPSDV